ncbi:MAG: hypothetical protein EOO62_38530 [Hymenobacter sp.]|nr:MAG: hypothetical protein EOO62_38530 [Hymenobacter sp.]
MPGLHQTSWPLRSGYPPELWAIIRFSLLLFVLTTPSLAHAQKAKPEPYPQTIYPVYNGPDLGLTFDRTGRGTLRVWAPTAEALRLPLYAAGASGPATATHAMQRGPSGTWVLALPPGTTGFYTVQATIAGKERAEVCEPYARPWA